MTQMYFINKVMWAHPKYFDLITDSFNAMYFQNSLTVVEIPEFFFKKFLVLRLTPLGAG